MECACYTRYTSVMSPEARQRRPPPGPFVLPQDRVPRRKSGVVGGADAPGAEPDNTPHWWSCRLCTHKDAPAWMVYNNSIHTGYRTNFTFRDALRSVWMLHNETANIWTHIVGLVVFVVIVCSMAFGWGGAHLHALPSDWTVGSNATKAALVAQTVRFRHTVKVTGSALRGVAAAVKNNEALHAAATSLVAVAQAVEAKLHGAELGTAPLRQGLVKRVHDAKWVIATHVSGSETAITNAYHASINHMLAHAAELHSMLEDSITSTADSQSPHWQFDTPELPGPYAPRWPMYVFLAGAIVCLSFSAVCHTLACVGARVSTIVWRVDYVGIAVLIVASFFPGGVLLVPVRAFRASFVFGNDDYAWFPDVGGYPVGKIPRRAVLSAAGAFVFIARRVRRDSHFAPILVHVALQTHADRGNALDGARDGGLLFKWGVHICCGGSREVETGAVRLVA